MFGLKRKRAAEPDEFALEALESLDRVDLIASPNLPRSALEAFATVRPVAERYGHDARLYLVLSAEVNPSGLANTWEFHYIFPERHAEGRFMLRSGTSSESGQAELHSTVTPFPMPGTPEHTMAQSGGYMITIVEQAWQARLERIDGLPIEFHDSTEAVEDMQRGGHPLFSGGLLRMKGRTLPSGESVWEAITLSEIVHSAFGFDTTGR